MKAGWRRKDFYIEWSPVMGQVITAGVVTYLSLVGGSLAFLLAAWLRRVL